MVERHNGTLIGGHIQPRHRNIYLSFIKSPPEYGTKHMNEAQFSRRYRHTHTHTHTLHMSPGLTIGALSVKAYFRCFSVTNITEKLMNRSTCQHLRCVYACSLQKTINLVWSVIKKAWFTFTIDILNCNTHETQ